MTFLKLSWNGLSRSQSFVAYVGSQLDRVHVDRLYF